MPMTSCVCGTEFFVISQGECRCKGCGQLYLDGEIVKGPDAAGPDPVLAALAGITLTTGYAVAGREIEREIDIVTAECAFGHHVIKDLAASMRDFFGGRSGTVQTTLRDCRKTALAELRKEALAVGADAVIGVDLDYGEMGSGGTAMLFLVASGTAVKLKPQGA